MLQRHFLVVIACCCGAARASFLPALRAGPLPAAASCAAAAGWQRASCLVANAADFLPAAEQEQNKGIEEAAAAADAASSSGWLAGAMEKSAGPASDALAAVRESAAAVLSGMSFPGRKEEAWRRTDLSWLAGASIVAPATEAAAAAALLDAVATEGSAGMRLVLVDGVYDAALSDLSALPAGVRVGGLSSGGASEQAQAVLQEALPETGADPRTALGILPFAALNQASIGDVAYVDVDAGTVVERPLHVVCLTSGPEGADGAAAADRTLSASHPNLVVSVGGGASLELLQLHHGEGGYYANAITRVRLAEDACLRHSYLQEQSRSAVHVDSLVVDCAAGSHFKSAMLQSGGRISRLNIQLNLNGVGAHGELQGLTLATDEQLIDVHSTIKHASPDCTSGQEQRNAVAGRARVVFRGAVNVPTGADNTTAAQLCRSLLLSDNARVDIQPILTIDTDDVVCTHGATVSTAPTTTAAIPASAAASPPRPLRPRCPRCPLRRRSRRAPFCTPAPCPACPLPPLPVARCPTSTTRWSSTCRRAAWAVSRRARCSSPAGRVMRSSRSRASPPRSVRPTRRPSSRRRLSGSSGARASPPFEAAPPPFKVRGAP